MVRVDIETLLSSVMLVDIETLLRSVVRVDIETLPKSVEVLVLNPYSGL